MPQIPSSLALSFPLTMWFHPLWWRGSSKNTQLWRLWSIQIAITSHCTCLGPWCHCWDKTKMLTFDIIYIPKLLHFHLPSGGLYKVSGSFGSIIPNETNNRVVLKRMRATIWCLDLHINLVLVGNSLVPTTTPYHQLHAPPKKFPSLISMIPRINNKI